MIDFTEKYSLLFFSLVFLCFGYGILLVFYVNDKISEIDKAHHIKSRQVSEADQNKISDDTKKAKATLGRYCKKLMMIFLAVILVFNTILHILAQSGHSFLLKADSNSCKNRTAILSEGGHGFLLKTDSRPL